jgi:hypothetical protein
MLRKIFLALFAVLMVIAMVLSGCGDSNNKQQKGIPGGADTGYPAGNGANGPASTAYPGP